MLSNKLEGSLAQRAAARGLAKHRLVGGEQLFSFASLLFLGLYFSFFVIFVTISMILIIKLLNCSSLNPEVFSLLPFQFSSPYRAGEGSKWLCSA